MSRACSRTTANASDLVDHASSARRNRPGLLCSARSRPRNCNLGPDAAGGLVPGIGRSYFVDTLSTLGVFTELQELSEAVYIALDEMYRAHLGWDGKTLPVRPYPALTRS